MLASILRRLRFAPMAFLLLAGCASAYHSYSPCAVNCNYCPPPPLAYRHYEGCVCHACVVSPYLTTGSDSHGEQSASTVSEQPE